MTDTPASTIFEPADFFISYTGVDEECAEWIGWCLEDGGYKVILQKWDFRPGYNFVLAMHAAALVARHTMPILSPAYQEALFTGPEWAGCFAHDPTGKSRKLLPVRVVEFQPDGLFRAIIYIDLVKHLRTGDKDGARQELLLGVSEDRTKPLCEPPFPSYGGNEGDGTCEHNESEVSNNEGL